MLSDFKIITTEEARVVHDSGTGRLSSRKPQTTKHPEELQKNGKRDFCPSVAPLDNVQ